MSLLNNTGQSNVKAMSVSELTSKIKNQIEPNFFNIAVEGEISNYKVSYTGHSYFTLKDSKSELPAVMFKQKFLYSQIKISDGMKVIAFGNIIVYEPRGSYQLNVNKVLQSGQGDLQLEFERLKKKLFDAGWFDASRKKKIPGYPEKIGIITSPSGAAIEDILNVIKRRFPKVTIYIYPVSVQGSSAKFEIKSAFDYFKKNPVADVIILSRGGGSIEDLWPFNEEIVAESIYNCKIPVITGIGHEIDFTISDFVGDLRAPTPSAAAELAVPDLSEISNSFIKYRKLLYTDLTSKIRFAKKHIDSVKLSRPFKYPFYKIEILKQFCDESQLRLSSSLTSKYNFYKKIISGMNFYSKLKLKIDNFKQSELLKKNELKKLLENKIASSRLQTGHLTKIINKVLRIGIDKRKSVIAKYNENLIHLNPLNIIDRGYSVVFTETNKTVNSVKNVKSSDKLNIQVKDGKINCEVVSVENK